MPTANFNTCLGMTLVELLVAMLIGAILLNAVIQVAAGARSSFRLQEGLAEVQENGRFVIDSLGDILHQTDFSPEPWSETANEVGLSSETDDAVTTHGDRLAVRTWSEHNCFGNPNPVSDAGGLPEFFLKESVLELNSSNNLTHTCRYGSSADQFITQIQRQGLLQNVEAFQVQYAEDVDADGNADRWVDGGQWLDERRVLGFQLAVLLSSRESLIDPNPATYSVLNHVVTSPADGRLRRVFTFSMAFRGRTG